ncbi:MAG TPA: hypothetical protein D7H86_07690 [Candidatus Poseidoniales archaeon]|nr:MAG TPA: hypothetical protein D7H86_07690 [Candidatus Poseidoniales archaeon]
MWPLLRYYVGPMNRPVSIFVSITILLFFMPLVLASVPVTGDQVEENEEKWWVNTTVDKNKNKIGDMVEKYHDHPLFLDDENTIPVIVDFDHEPGEDEVMLLEKSVDFQHQWTLKIIDAIAGRVPVNQIWDLTKVEGVVMVELDGILEIANADAAANHGVIEAREETGYDGAGSTVAIIDTGIDGNHVGLDDLDDVDATYDPKIIAFYDPVNNPEQKNGTEVFPYDDQGHGSHCAGTTAGTGAPDFQHVGMAPGAKLVGVKVLDAGGSGSFGTVMAGMEWTSDKRFEYNIRSASMSLGGFGLIEWTSSEEDSVNRAANEMVRDGIAMFIAAGNTAITAQIGTPGSAEDVITVGALDKDTGIAPYSSQGPTEEGRVKPNVAYTGSDVMSVEANSVDGYVAFSGTSMATPGAAGVAALMYQANPQLSPFDIRNIMQETATYRQCHYMFKNEGCPEDVLPKNRQNNVYGHGHVNGLESVLEAAQSSNYDFNQNITLTLLNQPSKDNRININGGGALLIEVTQSVDTIQWRSNHLRDDWSTLHSYEYGTSVTLDHETLVNQIEHLPGITIEGNHTISIRAIDEVSSSPLITADIKLGPEAPPPEVLSEEVGLAIKAGLSLIVLVIIGFVIAGFISNKYETEEISSIFIGNAQGTQDIGVEDNPLQSDDS